MRRLPFVVLGLGLLAFVPALRAADEPKPLSKQTEKAFTFPKQIQLTDEQKTKLEDLKKEYGPKLEEINARVAPIMTPERQKAANEARKKATDEGKKGKEVQEAVAAALNLPAEDQAKLNEANKDRSKLMKEINAKKTDLLTDEQKAQLKPKNSK